MVYNPSKETYILSSVNLIHGKTSHLRNVIMIKLHVYRIVQTVLRLIDYILSLEFGKLSSFILCNWKKKNIHQLDCEFFFFLKEIKKTVTL